ncbi:MAG: hypothetical protein QXD50_04975 [Desulfurococcaceae archaeon]
MTTSSVTSAKTTSLNGALRPFFTLSTRHSETAIIHLFVKARNGRTMTLKAYSSVINPQNDVDDPKYVVSSAPINLNVYPISSPAPTIDDAIGGALDTLSMLHQQIWLLHEPYQLVVISIQSDMNTISGF